MGIHIYQQNFCEECYCGHSSCCSAFDGLQTQYQYQIEDYHPYPYPTYDYQMKLRLFDNHNRKNSLYYPMQDSPQIEEQEKCKSNSGLTLLAKVCENIQKTEEIKTEEQNVPIDYSLKTAKNEEVLTPSIPEASTSKEITVHRRIMTCEHCGKTFTHKGDMNKHLRKHTGEQPFSCPICDRKFAHTSNLARHLKVHSGDKPFHCDRCKKSFSRKDKLVMHQKTKLCLKSGHSSSSS